MILDKKNFKVHLNLKLKEKYYTEINLNNNFLI